MDLAPAIASLKNFLLVISDTEHAVGGVVQLAAEGSQDLHIAAHHGLSEGFVRHYANRTPGDGTPYTQALAERRRVVIRDVEADEAYAPHLAVTQNEGILAIQATPLISAQRHSLGVLTTFYSKAQHPGAESLRLIDQCADGAMLLIEAVNLQAKLSRLFSRSGMPFRPIDDHVVRSADAAKGLLKSLNSTNYLNMLPVARRNLKQVVAELEFQVARQEV
ncbi:MAG: GAF domain-containing protein [Gammaproteobacteria bacterium]